MERQKAQAASDDELPARLALHDEDAAWRVWSLLEATEWRWPPDVLLRQDEALMEDISAIAWLNGVVRQVRQKAS